jgi:hypothetical protein
MPIALARWFLDDGEEGRARVESLVTRLLVQARWWTGPRDADALGRARWVSLSPKRARIVGEFYDLASLDHMFWPEVSAEGERVRWSLDCRPDGLTWCSPTYWLPRRRTRAPEGCPLPRFATFTPSRQATGAKDLREAEVIRQALRKSAIDTELAWQEAVSAADLDRASSLRRRMGRQPPRLPQRR